MKRAIRPDELLAEPQSVAATVEVDEPDLVGESSLRDRFDVDVSVRDVGGAPIPSAQVRIGRHAYVDADVDIGQEFAVTGLDGRVSLSTDLPADDAWVAVRAHNYFPALVHVGTRMMRPAGNSGAVSLQVVLQAPFALTVDVVDVNSRPLESAVVRAIAPWGEEASKLAESSISRRRLSPRSTTGPSGRCDLRLAQEEAYELEVTCAGHVPFLGPIDASSRASGHARIVLDQLFVAALRIKGLQDPRRVSVTTADYAQSVWSNQSFVDEVWSAAAAMQKRFGVLESHCFVAAGNPALRGLVDDEVVLLANGQRRNARLNYREFSRFAEDDVVEVAFDPPRQTLGTVVVEIAGVVGNSAGGAYHWTLVRMDDHVHPRLDPSSVDGPRVVFLDVPVGDWSLAIARPRFMDGYVANRPRFRVDPGAETVVTVAVPEVSLVRPSLIVEDSSGRLCDSYRATLFSSFTGFIPLRDRVGVPIGVYDLMVEKRGMEKAVITMRLDAVNESDPIRVRLSAAPVMVAGGLGGEASRATEREE